MRKKQLFQKAGLVFLALLIVGSSALSHIAFLDLNQNRAFAEEIHDDGSGGMINPDGPQEYEESIISKNATYTGTPGEYFIDLKIEGKDNETVEPTDIVLVYDNSNSMNNNNRVGIARDAVTNFINNMLTESNENIRMALVTYGTHVMDGRANTVYSGNMGNFSYKTLTTNPNALINQLPSNVPSNRGAGNNGGTYTQEALVEANSILSSSNADNKVIITITDGAPTFSHDGSRIRGNGTSFFYGSSNHGTNTINTAQGIQGSGIDMYSIGIELRGDAGASLEQVTAVMEGIASTPGQYYGSENVNEISDILRDIARNLTGTVIGGRVTDPMGDLVELSLIGDSLTQATDNELTDGDYFLTASQSSLLEGVTVNLDGETLTLDNLNLGAGQFVNLRYKVHLDTDHEGFAGGEYFATNGTTTFVPNVNQPDTIREFEVPVISGTSIEVSGVKIWEDAGGEMNRPPEIEIHLYRTTGDRADGTFVETVTVTPNENDEWGYVFEGQPSYSPRGAMYEYYVQEVTVDGYTTEYSEDGLDVINTLEAEPSISLEKTSDVEEVTEAGQTVIYTFNVENTGNITLNNIVLDDPMLGGSIELDATELAPGEVTDIQVEYIVTQDDINNGGISNTATVTGEDSSGNEPNDEDNDDIPGVQEPAISLEKTADRDDLVAGEDINYTFTATNTGNITLENVSISDVLEGISEITYAKINGEAIEDVENITLQPGDVLMAEANYTITQGDVDSGVVENTATVTGTPPDSDEPVTDDDNVSVPQDVEGNLTLQKSSDTEEFVEAGQIITYEFLITNDSNVTINNIVLMDDMLGGDIELDVTELAPGESTTVSREYEVTQDDVNNGNILNAATVTGEDPNGGTPTDEDEEETPGSQNPGISLEKTADRDDLVAEETINYRFTATNTGNVTLENVSISDVLEGISDITYATVNGEAIEDVENLTLKPGDVLIAEANYTITQADVDSGVVENTATVEGTPPNSDEPVTDDDNVSVPQDVEGSITLEKSSEAEAFVEAGQIITYDFLITNDSNVTITNIVLNDEKLGGTIELPETELAPGDSITVSQDYEVTQADLDAGNILNVASVVGEDPNGETPTDEDEEDIPGTQNPSISLEKEADRDDLVLDELINYTFTATNTGNVTLENVSISDVLEGISDITYATINGEEIEDVENITLQPGDVLVANANYTITQGDVDSGIVENTATVYGSPPNSDEPIEDEDNVSVPQDVEGNLTLQKSTETEEFVEAGQIITYEFVITNDSNVTVDNIVLTDEMLGGNIELDVTELAPGESTTVSRDYEVTQDDVNAGNILNAASVTGEDPRGGTPGDEDEEDTPGNQNPGISLEKTADRDGLAADEDINYTFTVTNTGNVTLSNVSISDVLEGISEVTYATINGEEIDDVGNITLQPGDVLVANANYTITQGDVDSGVVENTATAEGTPPNSDEPVTDDDDVSVPQDVEGSLTLQKSSDLESFVEAGQTVTYEFLITNDSNVTINNIVLTDEMLGGNIELDVTELAPGESTTVSREYEVTQADVNNGNIDNLASVTGEDPRGGTPGDEDEDEIPGEQNPGISLEKVADRNDLDVDEQINYTFTATNTGNVTLENVGISDVLEGISDITYATINGEEIDDADNITLQPGDVLVANANYTITQADVDAGVVDNTATVYGTPPGTDEPIEDDDSTSVPQDVEGDLTLQKSSNTEEFVEAGQIITYEFLITNDSNVTITNLALNDDMLGGNIELDVTELAPGESTIVSRDYEVTQDDVNAGNILNAASVTGEDPRGGTPTDEDEEDTPGNQNPSISLEKTADRDNLVTGENINYTFTVTNTGNVTLSNVSISDVLEGISDITYATINGEAIEDVENITLQPGDVLTAEASYTITQEDVNNGSVENNATVSGTPPDSDEPVTDDDTVTVSQDVEGDLTLEKTSDTESVSVAGDTITYDFKITNNSNVTITDIVLTDEMLGGTVELPDTELTVGQSMEFSVEYTVIEEDLESDNVINIASVIGETPNGSTPPSEDEVNVPVVPEGEPDAPSISLEKTVGEDTEIIEVGQVITYNFTVTNNGNVPLSNIVLDDPMLGGSIELETTELAPEESTEVSVEYTVTEEDFESGSVLNSASVSGETPEGDTATDEDEVIVPVVPIDDNPLITLEKSSNVDQVTEVGETVIYTFTITNNGDVDLTDVVLNDAMLGGNIELDTTTLAAGESTTVSVEHQVTEEQFGFSTITNKAIASGVSPNNNLVYDIDDVVITTDGPIDEVPVPDSQTKKTVNGKGAHKVENNSESFVFEIETVINPSLDINSFSIFDSIDDRLAIGNVDVMIGGDASAESSSEELDTLEENRAELVEELEAVEAELKVLQTTLDEALAVESEEAVDEETEEVVEEDVETNEELTAEEVTENDEETITEEVAETEEPATEENTEEAPVEETEAVEEETSEDIQDEANDEEEVQTEEDTMAEVTVNTEAIEAEIAELNNRIETLIAEIEAVDNEIAELDTDNVEISAGSILDYGELSVNGQDVQFTITDSEVIEALKGQTIKMTIDATFSSVDQSAITDGVENTATITFDNQTEDTNTVYVLPAKEDEPEVPEPEVPEEPEEPTEPEQPEKPTEPEEPTESEQPEEPTEPEHPEESTEPEKTEGNQGTPTEGEGAQTSDKPAQTESNQDSGGQSDGKDSDTKAPEESTDESEELPLTGIPMNNTMILVIGLLLIGGTLFFFTRKKKE